MGRAPEQPRWALVKWPNRGLGRIPLEYVDSAERRGALVIARESDLLPWQRLTSCHIAQSNPRRVPRRGREPE